MPAAEYCLHIRCECDAGLWLCAPRRAQVLVRAHREAHAHTLLQHGPQGGAPKPKDVRRGE